jgi:anti-anti-sigma regulatory factor
MLRITETFKDLIRTIKVDGRLLSGETEVLVQACEGHPGTLVIDLSDLHFADHAGIRVLRELKAQGARIVGARPYLSLQLAEQDGPIGGSQ